MTGTEYDNTLDRPPQELPILFRDQHYIAIDKPAGMLVHRSELARHETVFVLQALRDQIGQRVYPVHRLDRATSGVLIFALNSEAARALSQNFETKDITKIYHAVARGWLPEAGRIEHPVRDPEQRGSSKPSITHYRPLALAELEAAVDRYPTSRYTLVEVEPETGRRHQIRQHFKHISHHLIGDTTYGNGKHNRFFREQLQIPILLLRAISLSFTHPYTARIQCIDAGANQHWLKLKEIFHTTSKLNSAASPPRG